MAYGINSYPPEQNGRHFADDMSMDIFMNDKFGILIQTSLLFVSKGPIDKKAALVLVMAWRGAGDKPLPEPRLT